MQWSRNPPPSSAAAFSSVHICCARSHHHHRHLYHRRHVVGENSALPPSGSPCCCSCCCCWGWQVSGGCWSIKRRSTAHRPHSRPLGIPAQKTSGLESMLILWRRNNELSFEGKKRGWAELGKTFPILSPECLGAAAENQPHITLPLCWNLVLVSIKFIMV